MTRISRRAFTRGVGLAALFAPFMSLVGRTPTSAAATGRNRYLLVFYSNGTDVNLWTPRGSTPTSIAFSEMTAPLEPLRSELVLIEKLSSLGTADNHAAPGGLTGYGYSGNNRVSIDQFVATRMAAAGATTPIPSLILGSVATEQQTAFYRDNQVLSPIFSPTAAYDTLFGGVVGGGGGGEALLRRRQSALDLVGGELRALQDQLGSEERRKLELHADSLRQVEERLTGGGGGTCDPGAPPGDIPEALLASSKHLDLAITAFACDLTRVASVQFGHHQSTQVSLSEVGAPGDWHNNFIHGDNPRTRLVNLERWMCGQFVAAANRLKSLPAPDGDGTLYDQTLMVWARDMGDAITHNGNDMRFVFAGGGGYLDTAPGGRYIDGGGEGHQRALLNVAEAMGVADFTGFGDPNGPRAPLPAIGG